MMSDCEGGGKWSNRCDNFMVIHRYVQHAMDWMITNVHVRKVKDTDTGMMPTSLDSVSYTHLTLPTILLV